MRLKLTFLVGFAAAVMIAASCAALKTSSPIMPQKDLEKMLAGPLEAEYVGNENCLKSCHDHDQIALNLRESVHGHQTEEATGMPLVNCETCHGPGSQAVAKAAADKKCDVGKLVALSKLPSAAQNVLCLRCHSSHSMATLQFWSASRHAQSDVSCSDCHRLHTGPNQKITGKALNEICYGCHGELKAEFSMFSRHPLAEGKMTCASCHNAHGSLAEKNLRGADVKALCAKCHAEKVGPFVFEHADQAEDCCSCHRPHGSPFSGLLRYQEPFLCLECHTGHTEHDSPANPSQGYKRAIFTACTKCHSQIHGTDRKGDLPRSGFIY